MKNVIGINKKLAEILHRSVDFQDQIERVLTQSQGRASSQQPPIPALDEALDALDSTGDHRTLEGRDIDVCIRVRPLLSHETSKGFFSTTFARGEDSVTAMEPRIDVRGEPRVKTHDYHVDFAFGPDNTTHHVYDNVTRPLIELGLKGGVCTLLAYGQTGSGKTFTTEGILRQLGRDLLRSSQADRWLKPETTEGALKLHMAFYEILGNQATDLMKETRPNVGIMEDKFGQIVVKGASEVELVSDDQFEAAVDRAMSHRRTKTTFKNDTSSRSHAVCAIRVENTTMPAAEHGRIFVIDLAGSESASDSQFHDRSLIKETQMINGSLMALKECIRNRALSALNPDKFYHIPYRNSKLTLLLKDALEVESHRQCKTVVMACVSPSCADVGMTLNTLRYVTPIRVGQSNREKIEPNPKNPANWSNSELRHWVETASKGAVNPDILCPFESGRQILRLSEIDFLSRVMESNPKMGEKRAKTFYVSLWKKLIDCRTAMRKEKLKAKPLRSGFEPIDMDVELTERVAKEAEEERKQEEERINKLTTFTIRA